MTTCSSRMFPLVALALSAAACESKDELDGAALGQQVCECTTRANAMDGNDPDRPAAQKQCDELQRSTWKTVEGTAQQDAYNAQFPCGL